MAKISLKELKISLNLTLTEPEILDCGDFNLLKIFQHAYHKTAVGSRSVSRIIWDKSILYQQIFTALKRIQNQKIFKLNKKKISKLQARSIILYTGGNIVTSEKAENISSNAYNLVQAAGQNRCLYIYNEVNRGIVECGQELNGSEVFNCGRFLRLDQDDILLLKALQKTYQKSDVLCVNDALLKNNFKSQIQQLFDDFRSWKYVFQIVKPDAIYFAPHYHNEGLVLACKSQKIKAIELQHGLISREDYYYSYPPEWSGICERALFADEILVFGEFWKTELLLGNEYKSEQIKIIGKYQYHPSISEESIKKFIKKYRLENKKVIAICTQTNLPDFYADYTRKLSDIIKNNAEYVIVVKPHPRQIGLEKIEASASLPNVRVMDKSDNLMVLLNLSEIQISIYSTTFFDAIGSGTINFSLQNVENNSEYASTMVEQGIAHALKVDENPINLLGKFQSEKDVLNPDSVYAPFKPDFWNL